MPATAHPTRIHVLRTVLTDSTSEVPTSTDGSPATVLEDGMQHRTGDAAAVESDCRWRCRRGRVDTLGSGGDRSVVNDAVCHKHCFGDCVRPTRAEVSGTRRCSAPVLLTTGTRHSTSRAAASSTAEHRVPADSTHPHFHANGQRWSDTGRHLPHGEPLLIPSRICQWTATLPVTGITTRISDSVVLRSRKGGAGDPIARG